MDHDSTPLPALPTPPSILLLHHKLRPPRELRQPCRSLPPRQSALDLPMAPRLAHPPLLPLNSICRSYFSLAHLSGEYCGGWVS